MKTEYTLLLGFLGLLLISTPACKKKNSPTPPEPIPTNTFTTLLTPTTTATPTVTSSPTRTSTPTPTATPTSQIDWESAAVYHSDNYGSSSAYVYLAVNGLPVTTAGVTLGGTFSGAPLAMLSDGNVYPIGGKNYALYEVYGFTWQSGQSYSITTVTTSGTASATLTAPGGITFAPLDAHGAVTQVGWTTAGTFDYVYVNESSPVTQQTFNTTSGGSALSPVAIPGTAYPGGNPSVYTINANVIRQLYFIPGATSTSSLQVYESNSKSVTWN